MAKDDVQYRRHMNSALDDELSADEQAALEAHLDESTEAAEEWDRMRTTDHLLRETPLTKPSPGFTGRVMAAIAAMPVPDFARQRLGLGLALGLTAAAMLSVPVLSLLLVLLVVAFTDPATISVLFQASLDVASYTISLGSDIASEIRAAVSDTWVLLALIGAVIPLTLLWGWLMRSLLSGPKLLADRQKTR